MWTLLDHERYLSAERKCTDMLRYGEIIELVDCNTPKDFIRRYIIRYGEKDYEMVKVNGYWSFYKEI